MREYSPHTCPAFAGRQAGGRQGIIETLDTLTFYELLFLLKGISPLSQTGIQ